MWLLIARHWKLIANGLAVLAAFSAGWSARDSRCDAAKAKADRAAVKASAKMQDNADSASTQYETDRSEGHAYSQAQQERVRIIYRDRPVSADCAVPDDARSVLAEAVRAANTGNTR